MTLRSAAHACIRWGNVALDLVYPRQCQICGGTARCRQFSFLCDDCFGGTARLRPPWCEVCSLPFQGEMRGLSSCANCGEREMHFDRAYAVMRFQGAVRHAIHGLKYSRQMYWSKALRRWFAEGSRSVDWEPTEIDLAVPVPLHPVRERERGFNQASVLLAGLQEEWKIPVHRRVLRRIRKTETQTHLDREERRSNLHGAFEIAGPKLVRGKRVLLVDDVLTTGSTAAECSRVLREAGATSVLVFTLARG